MPPGRIWVSAAISPHGHAASVLKAFQDRRVAVVISREILEEIEAVLARPRLVRKYPHLPAAAEELLSFLRLRAELVVIPGEPQLCRDPKDDKLIETAIRGKAEVIVSRDEDLTRALELQEHLAGSGIEALTLRQFLRRLPNTP